MYIINILMYIYIKTLSLCVFLSLPLYMCTKHTCMNRSKWNMWCWHNNTVVSHSDLNQEKVNKQQRSRVQSSEPPNPQKGPPKESAATVGHQDILALTHFVSKPVAIRQKYACHHMEALYAVLENIAMQALTHTDSLTSTRNIKVMGTTYIISKTLNVWGNRFIFLH